MKNLNSIWSKVMMVFFILYTYSVHAQQTVNLNTYIHNSPPVNTTLQWHNNTPPGPANLISGTSVTAAGPGTYYAVFYDPANNCYGTENKLVITANTCPTRTVNLTDHQGTNLPPFNSQLEWHKGFPVDATNLVRSPEQTAASAGIYYAVYHDTQNNCYGNIAPLIVLVDSCTPLPVGLTSFTVIKQDNQAHLSWETATEQNSDYFGIEHSNDGTGFNEIGKVVAIGNTSTGHSYGFIDAGPLSGMNYYRLKITDKDRRLKYSQVRMLSFDKLTDFNLYPNPVTADATLNGLRPGMQVELYNNVGQRLAIYHATGEQLFLQTRYLPQGLYQVHVLNVHGQKLSVVKLIKN
jgi:hypothetical protein